MSAVDSCRRLLFLDCDSTLSAIEGVDELARLRGPGMFEQIAGMTRDAMDGGAALETIFARRLELIQPTRDQLQRVAALYLEHLEPDASQAIARLRATGWTPVILSGGFRQAIQPLAERLGIGRVEAVDLCFNDDGTYRGYAHDYPTTRARGKNTVINAFKAAHRPLRTVMVGDGASDLETMPDVDFFVGFGRYARREKVRAGASAYILGFAELPGVLQGLV
ncbi:MAG: HAD-IB family phosphatase [Puniceicoccales bacterium]|jgi:phosphoserine phosphatase|nr:HAD-IB family phosphatase [Puniceicoccales bacterium]